ncbi:MAG: hypothetical protein K2I82_01965 [Ruminococcus sp.]|nr:hypothetical protein [Ruminococcus sp.]
MKKVLIYYDEECEQMADTIIDNYKSHDIYCEKICTTIQDDIEYAKENGFSEAIFIEVNEKLVLVYIKSGYIFESGLDDLLFKE